MLATYGVLLIDQSGEGLWPVSASVPLPLLPFFNVPVVDVLAAQLARAGVVRCTVCVAPGSEAVVRHVRETWPSRFPALTCDFADAESLAMRVAEACVGGHPAWVVSAGRIFLAALSEMAEAHGASRRAQTFLMAPDERREEAFAGAALMPAESVARAAPRLSHALERASGATGALGRWRARFAADVSTVEGYLAAHRRGWAHVDALLALGLHRG